MVIEMGRDEMNAMKRHEILNGLDRRVSRHVILHSW